MKFNTYDPLHAQRETDIFDWDQRSIIQATNEQEEKNLRVILRARYRCSINIEDRDIDNMLSDCPNNWEENDE